MNKKFKIVQIVIILLILIGSIGAYFFINNKKVEKYFHISFRKLL